ncbi:MAG: hypothetical protein QM652_11550 [Legionella sp.]|uniref:hypothetical protein n=1 Tax=Legionella sp. TaxID=459 RepID=UPI0039E41E87
MPIMFFKNKPDPKKSFFQNYYDHLKHLEKELTKLWETEPKTINLIVDEALKRMSLFERLRDRYDYMDEVVGATALPLMGMIASGGLLLASIWEGTQALAVHLNMVADHNDDHGYTAAALFVFSVGLAIASAATFLKSAISLVTRPVITALEGFAPQDKARFEGDSFVARAESFLESLSY